MGAGSGPQSFSKTCGNGVGNRLGGEAGPLWAPAGVRYSTWWGGVWALHDGTFSFSCYVGKYLEQEEGRGRDWLGSKRLDVENATRRDELRMCMGLDVHLGSNLLTVEVGKTVKQQSQCSEIRSQPSSDGAIVHVSHMAERCVGVAPDRASLHVGDLERLAKVSLETGCR